jgi:hypothetical protein
LEGIVPDKSLVGDLINFRGLVYAPLNEQGVVFLFGKVAHDLNMYVEEIKPGYPDCIARRFVGNGWQRIRVEFEYWSSNFVQHKHDPAECDLIVCWKHDWSKCPLEVIELSTVIRGLPNTPIERPGGTALGPDDIEAKTKAIFEESQPQVREWYDALFAAAQKAEPEVWAKVGEKYAGWYCPERAFASIKPGKKTLVFECFAGDQPLAGTQVANKKFAPRWAKLSVKSEGDLAIATAAVKQSVLRIKKAIKSGEQTQYFSGGVVYPGPEGSAVEKGLIGDKEQEES